VAKTGPCTCGVKHTGGLHSDWCDSLRQDEPVPDTQPVPSPFEFKVDFAPTGTGVLYVYENGAWRRVWRGWP
jgi:hypothetical protein